MNKSYRILWVASLILAFSTGFFIRPEGINSFNSSIVGTSDNAEYKPKTASSAINRPKKNRNGCWETVAGLVIWHPLRNPIL